MLSDTEIKILKRLFDDLTKVWTIREISLDLGLPYPQTHRSIRSLIGKNLVLKEKKGKSSLITSDFKSFKEEYLIVEIERKKEIIRKHKILKILGKDLAKIKQFQYLCILFGSYTGKYIKKESDIDLLFVIPEEYDYSQFGKEIRGKITISNVDINIITEKGLLEMWQHPLRFNVGNEILKKHVILRGAEAFLHLRIAYCMGVND